MFDLKQPCYKIKIQQMKHVLYREQQLNCDIETAWSFFSNPHNLSKITPKDMAFTVLSKDIDDKIYEGMEIEYTVSPILKIPFYWKTVITQVDNQKSFTDFQAKGPYKIWNHFHEFIPNKDGVLIKDTVTYELPLSFLGNIAHALFVKKKVHSIFAYRQEILNQKFNKK